jgi:hypothetical protein
LPFRSWSRLLVWFVLLNPCFLYSVLWTIICVFVLYPFAIVLSVRLISFGHCIVCSSYILWPLYRLFVVYSLAIVSSVRLISFGHCIVCSSYILWPLYRLFFDLRVTIIIYGMVKEKIRNHKKGWHFFLEPDWKIHIPINLHTGNNNQKYYSGDSVQMNLRNRFAVFWVEDVYI